MSDVIAMKVGWDRDFKGMTHVMSSSAPRIAIPALFTIMSMYPKLKQIISFSSVSLRLLNPIKLCGILEGQMIKLKFKIIMISCR